MSSARRSKGNGPKIRAVRRCFVLAAAATCVAVVGWSIMRDHAFASGALCVIALVIAAAGADALAEGWPSYEGGRSRQGTREGDE